MSRINYNTIIIDDVELYFDIIQCKIVEVNGQEFTNEHSIKFIEKYVTNALEKLADTTYYYINKVDRFVIDNVVVLKFSTPKLSLNPSIDVDIKKPEDHEFNINKFIMYFTFDQLLLQLNNTIYVNFTYITGNKIYYYDIEKCKLCYVEDFNYKLKYECTNIEIIDNYKQYIINSEIPKNITNLIRFYNNENYKYNFVIPTTLEIYDAKTYTLLDIYTLSQRFININTEYAESLDDNMYKYISLACINNIIEYAMGSEFYIKLLGSNKIPCMRYLGNDYVYDISSNSINLHDDSILEIFKLFVRSKYLVDNDPNLTSINELVQDGEYLIVQDCKLKIYFDFDEEQLNVDLIHDDFVKNVELDSEFYNAIVVSYFIFMIRWANN